MRAGFLIILFVVNGVLHSQNWNVFNKNYRYNYKYNYSGLVSNVLFVDTVKQSGTDTIYSLNRIGVECTGSCPTITTALSPGVKYVVANMPQFLQRKIRKYSNGLVQLFDTSKIVIVPTCTLNQTWLFDSVFNKTAVCTNISTLSIFGITDSVKTIIVQNVDTLVLSKSFGILQFPEPYAKNKYYRLVGIEKKLSYDAMPFYGERVPNAWDFYNFNVGDVFCSQQEDWNPWNSTCQKKKTTINEKTVLPTGYSYDIHYSSSNLSFNYLWTSPCAGPFYSMINNQGNITDSSSYNNLSNVSMIENQMYPNMILYSNIVKFGLDNTGRFYKYSGRPCSKYTFPAVPDTNAIIGIEPAPTNPVPGVLYIASGSLSAHCYAVGFGEVNSVEAPEYYSSYCLTGCVKNNIQYFGGACPDFYVGIPEQSNSLINSIIYPNPATNEISIQIDDPVEIHITNMLGQEVYHSTIPQKNKISVRNFENGIYIAQLKSSTVNGSQKFIVQH